MGGPELDDPREVSAGRLRQTLHRELGEVILAALADERVVEVMVNEDGAVWATASERGCLAFPRP
jgi:Flp pilus assembly CpaF family ATPase